MPSFASALSQPTLHGSQSDPKPDYVIVFDTSIKAGPPPKAKGNQTKHEQNKAQDKPDHVKERDDLQTEYTSLLGALEAAGLEATGRSGGKNSGQILIFVRASEERVQAEVHRERWVFDFGGHGSASLTHSLPSLQALRLVTWCQIHKAVTKDPERLLVRPDHSS